MAKDTIKGATLKDMPRDELAQLAATHPHVVITIKRRNNKGQLASLGYSGIRMSPDEVLNIASWIEPRSGGGTYTVDITSITDVHTRLIPPFEVVIEGAPRPPMPINVPMSTVPMMAGGPAPMFGGAAALPAGFDPFAPIPGAVSMHDIPRIPGVNDAPRQNMNWQQGVHPALQHLYAAETEAVRRQYGMAPSVALPPGASTASDMIALEQLRKAEAQLAQALAQLNAERQRSEERERAREKELRETQEAARNREHQMQIEALKLQMQTMNGRTTSAAEWVPLIAALAPVFTAMVTSGRDSSNRAAELQAQHSARTMDLIIAQTQKPQPPVPDPFDALAKITPLLALNKPDPTANVAMMEAQGSMQLQMMGMMAQMLESFGQSSGAAESPWMPIVQAIAGGLVQMSQAAQADMQRQRMTALPPPVQVSRPATAPAQQTAQPAQSTAVVVPYETVPSAQPAAPHAALSVQEQRIADLAAAAGVNPLLLDMLPQPFQTYEWKSIILSMLNKVDPEAISDLLAKHIGHLDEFGMLPPQLQNYHVDPTATFRSIVQPLPVYATDPAYCEAVIEGTFRAMLTLGILEEPQEEDATETDDETETADEPEAPEEQSASALLAAPAEEPAAH